jgi:hypothetical protein
LDRPPFQKALLVPTAISQSEAQTWPDDIVQVLDDHHLVVCAAAPAAADRFADALTRRLRQLAETQVIEIDGTQAGDITSFCRQIERQVVPRAQRRSLPHGKSWWRDIASLISLLRNTAAIAGAPKHRYIVWKDADVVLARDESLFGHLVNALLGVAAEQEHITPESLVLQRVVFIGSEALAAYADKPEGQFRRWLDEEGSPFWEVASVLDGPPVVTYRLEGLIAR